MPPDEPATGPPNPRRQLLEAAALGGLGLLALAGLVWWATADPSPHGGIPTPPPEMTRADFVGNAACLDCHAGIVAQHQEHGHHRTLRPAADRALARDLDGRQVPDPEDPGVSWAYHLKDGRFSVDRREGDRVDPLPIDFAFGSGYHATTFVSLLDTNPDAPVIREHRLTPLADQTLRVTPGQDGPRPLDGSDPLGRVISGPLAVSCFRCHVTLLSADDFDRLDTRTMIPSITCERCHGPGRAHIQAAQRGDDPDLLAMPAGPGRDTAAAQMVACGACHRHPSQAPPGSIRPDNLEIVRFQPVGLMQSACYTRSNGALRCTTCHDPHRHAEPTAAESSQTCLSCHAPAHPNQTPCPVSPSQDCISCHMPGIDSGQGILFTDHWIRVRDPLPASP
jgi:hypothetical protein